LFAVLAGRVLVAWSGTLLPFDFSPHHWSRWDSGHYLSIALEGYHYDDCASLGLGDAGHICQNVTWYPLLPWLMRAASGFGIDAATAGVTISFIAWGATVYLGWIWFLSHLPNARAFAGLSLMAVFPGTAYQHALFPVSLLSLGILLWLYFMSHGRWLWASVAAAAAGLAYPLGIVLVVASALWAGSLQPRWADQLRSAVTAGCVASVGSIVVFLDHLLEVGRWDASFAAQTDGGARLLNPFESLWRVIVAQDVEIQTYSGNEDLAFWTAWQTAVVACMVILTVFATWRGVRRSRTSTDMPAIIALVGMWIFPLMTWLSTGLYRREASLLPFAVVIARHLPPVVTILLAIGSLLALLGLTPLFFDYTLV
jgi:hypothetical protein